MTVVAARSVRDGQVCLVGAGIPAAAAHLARRVHAPAAVVVHESGALDVRLGDGPLTDATVADRALTHVGVGELYSTWLQAGRVDLAFLTADQLDLYGNIGSTVVGEYDEPTERLPGAGAAAEIAAWSGEVVVVMAHRLRAFVEQVDFVTAVGHGTGPLDRGLLGLRGRGPVRVVTDLGVLEPDPETAELVLTAVHPGVDVEQVRAETGWDLQVAPEVATTPVPTVGELAALRALRPARPATAEESP
ncbi:CoA-transferase [Pseudonocardia sp. N23]|uniref:CoA-transferase subunit beta n=1 Tax=Pseudonocardia sp. N23 TaxID=1987376 RepID=UPI000BFB95AB